MPGWKRKFAEAPDGDPHGAPRLLIVSSSALVRRSRHAACLRQACTRIVCVSRLLPFAPFFLHARQRALELMRQLPQFNKGCRVAKLFSKHMKQEEQAAELQVIPHSTQATRSLYANVALCARFCRNWQLLHPAFLAAVQGGVRGERDAEQARKARRDRCTQCAGPAHSPEPLAPPPATARCFWSRHTDTSFRLAGLDRLELVVLDLHKDVKKRSILDIPETRADWWELFKGHLSERVASGKTRLCLSS